MRPMQIKPILLLFSASFSTFCAAAVYEINGSPFATRDAPLPEYISPPLEKTIIVDPKDHVWGAYNAKGHLLRWGLATAGANWCNDIQQPCRTTPGSYHISFTGNGDCISSKFPFPGGGAPMPYCMYFNGNQAVHGSNEIDYANKSHGCVRVHVNDAKWLRYQFIDAPTARNHHRGTKIIIKPYALQSCLWQFSLLNMPMISLASPIILF